MSSRLPVIFIVLLLWFGGIHQVSAILAGGEFSLPADSPSSRLDAESAYSFVGALEISANGYLYHGSATVLSRNWVLTAGHNVDFNDDGLVDDGLGIHLHLPGYGSYSAGSFSIHPDFTGFGNPSIRHDLSLLYFEDPLPDLLFPTLGNSLSLNDTVALVGFGRSGYGDYGYTTVASLMDRRLGFNVIDELDDGLYRYDFDDPETGDGLGNTVETIIGPGDSGGALLVDGALVGVNTFTEGYGGRFGDFGGGIALTDEWAWIHETTGLAIPEPSSALLLLIGSGGLIVYRRARLRQRK
ncbi:trypsin-like serine protease [Pontiellaceae bacterium B12227]|nr:trypsin-like serine protease [Pontiellaceae bacterium B12227]